MKKIKKTGRKYNDLISIISVFIVIANLLTVFYVKYKIQNLPFENFRLSYIGNLLNLISSIVLIAGLIINIFRKNRLSDRIIITYTIFMTIFLIAGIINAFIRFPLPKLYFIEHPFRDVLTGFLFSAYQFVNFAFLSIIWLDIIRGRELILLNASVNAIIIMILFLFFAFIYINQNKTINKFDNNQDNVAVVLGAAVWSNNIPSPSLVSRADKALELYRKGLVSKIQLTGGNAPGELSEAEVAYLYLKKKGVDTNDLWVEKKTSNTAEQVHFVKEELIAKRNLNHIVFVSNSYHLTRINEICTFYNINAGTEPSYMNLSFDSKIYYKLRESIALLVFWFFAL